MTTTTTDRQPADRATPSDLARVAPRAELPRPRRAGVRALAEPSAPGPGRTETGTGIASARRSSAAMSRPGFGPVDPSPGGVALELLPPAGPSGRVPVPAAQRGVHGHAELVLRLVLEVVARRRPVTQLHGMATRRVLKYVAGETRRRTSRPTTPPDRPVRRAVPVRVSAAHGPGLHSLRVSHPADLVAEVSGVWQNGARFRAIAARFELLPRPDADVLQWRCTALRIG